MELRDKREQDVLVDAFSRCCLPHYDADRPRFRLLTAAFTCRAAKRAVRNYRRRLARAAAKRKASA